jgi:c-di-GMP-binding flagellar brake protein YcgR
MTQQLNEVVAANNYHDRRRREQRIACEREISLLPCANDDASQFIRARLSDCSAHGLGLVLTDKVEAGQQVLARVDINRQPTLLMYTIRYCIPTKADEFRAGARFSGFAAARFRGEASDVVDSLTGQ